MGRTTECVRCGDELNIVEDEWWQWRWEENPSRDTVEEAIEDPDFRDFFRENHVLCRDCHEVVSSVFEGPTEADEGDVPRDRAICPNCRMDTVHAVKRRRKDDPEQTDAVLTCGHCEWREP